MTVPEYSEQALAQQEPIGRLSQLQGPVDRFGELQILPGPGSWLTEPREAAGSLPESMGSILYMIQKSDQTGWPEPGSWLSDLPLEPWVRVQWAEQAG